MGWQEEITHKESEAIEELKKRTITEITPKMLEDDSIFYRFMKARDFNLKNAEDMLRKNIVFRKEYQVDTILTDYAPPEVITKYSPFTIICFDKEGCPVRYDDVGASDLRGVLESSKIVDFLKFNIQMFESDVELMKKQSEKLGKSITKTVYIYNFDKMTFAKATHRKSVEAILQGIKIFQDNYPERIKIIYAINASIYFSMLFSILKTVIDIAVMKKIRLHLTEGWKEALLEVIDADQLPAFLGGKRFDRDGDPFCRSFIKFGEVVPESYYLRKSEKRLFTSPDVKKLTVTRFSKLDLKFEVPEKGSLLEWEFETKSRDIAFGVYFKSIQSSQHTKIVEIISKQRIDTYYGPETGVYKCESAGTYIIVFDNSYSWIHSKEIYYNVRIIRPEDEENRQ